MQSLFESIEEWFHDLLADLIVSNLNTMFTAVNERTGSIATEVGKTPQGWNPGIFSMVRNLSNTVIVPIAGLIITFVLCYELISMINDRNNMHEFETYVFFKWVFKGGIAVYLLSHTFDIVMAVFDVGQYVVNGALSAIGGNTAIDISSVTANFEAVMEDMCVGDLLTLEIETFLMSFGMQIVSMLITVVIVARMIEIYLYVSISPIPFATFTNHEWGQIGNNYVRGLVALAFQGFFIMVIVGIYSVLVNQLSVATDLMGALVVIAAYTVVLCFALFKTGSISKSIFNAH